MRTYFRTKRGNKVLPSEARHGSYYLPKELRPELRKVWGIPIFGKEKVVEKKFKELILKKKFEPVVTVGDYCSLTLPSDIKIFDGKIERKKIKKLLPFSLNYSNPPGTIQKGVWSVIRKALKERKNVFIDGEEDLLVIPCVLLAKKSSAVIYGFPKKGVCLIEISPKIKKNIKELLKKFRSTNPL